MPRRFPFLNRYSKYKIISLSFLKQKQIFIKLISHIINLILLEYFKYKQAGNGPSRRHIQGSKIAKGLQNFKVLVNWDYSEKSRTVPKKAFGPVRYCILRGNPFWFSSLGQQVHFGVFWNFCRTFGRTILVNSGGPKNVIHNYTWRNL